jgi:1-acyl-sn-glycerol-3-phosphate acyltransferase
MRLLAVIHGVFAFAAIMVVTGLLSLAVIVALVVLRLPARAGRLIARTWARLNLLVSGVRVRLEGLERVDPSHPFVLAANHESQFDILVLQGWFPHPFSWLAKQELFRIPLLGQAMHRLGDVPVDRGKGRAALRSLAEAAARIAAGTSVVVFPEGTRSPDGFLQEFKTGAMILAIKAGVPVVPVAILGSREVLPRGRLLVRPGTVTVRFGEPIPTAGLTLRDKEALAGRVRAALLGLGCRERADA